MAKPGLKGELNTLKKWNKRIATYGVETAQKIAEESAPKITTLAARAYDTGRNVYGDQRELGKEGQVLDLVESEDTRRTLKFAAIGTLIRCVLGPRYAKYLVGKYKILPINTMPKEWSNEIRTIALKHTDQHFTDR